MTLRTIGKWFAIAVGGIVAIALIAVAGISVLIEIDLRRTFDVEGTAIAVPDDQASVVEGERLARLRGCFDGCHGETVHGQVFFEIPDGTRVVAPDLSRAIRDYSVEEFDRIVRHGVQTDGTSVISIMPSTMFYNLSDDDLGAIMAFLRSQPQADESPPDTTVGPLGRVAFLFFRNLFGTILAAEEIDHDAPRIDSSAGTGVTYGRYLAMTVCTECHGHDLRGAVDETAPTLAIVAAYSLDDFRKLMREGKPVGGRELDLMADVAESRFAYFTDAEVSDLYSFLKTLAASAR